LNLRADCPLEGATVRIDHLRPGQEPQLLEAAALFDERPDLAAACAYLAEESNVFLLACEGAQAVGFLRGTGLLQLKSVRKQMLLYEIAVLPKFQRRGIARELIRTLLDFCRGKGFEEVFVLTDPGNAAAVRLYESTGAVTETPADRMYVYRL
jgi:aminoglycoside 3-N-acetyltransferase I